ncbi:hypothetical protein CYMTET_41156 [Cymbomonas tetramitiformis]|uniref:Uncharacterized protein n=1 Tax=Cymbomonas tetramitiformis TaxID=36881 RepID=A0AAE0F3X8_9CHLO|nr:hypothetical protein CYMTET_41156 [Cymbomonas tetramitiformis]
MADRACEVTLLLGGRMGWKRLRDGHNQPARDFAVATLGTSAGPGRAKYARNQHALVKEIRSAGRHRKYTKMYPCLGCGGTSVGCYAAVWL